MSLNDQNKVFPAFMYGGGESGELIRNIDWSVTPLGIPDSWSPCLKMLTGTMLSTLSPVLICWGKQYVQLYNDAFRPILGKNKHPRAMGISASETYEEIWDTIGPMFEDVMAGHPVSFPDFMVPMDRNGYSEDCYFNFSYSPIRDEDGKIGGVLVICTETTEKVNSLKELKETNRQLVIAKTADFIAMKRIEESEERFRIMAEATDIMIAVADESSHAVYFNHAWVELTGRPMEELLEFGWADLIHPEEKESWLENYIGAFRQRIPFEGEFRILSKNGDYRWLLAKGPPRFHNDGRFAGYISSCIDITERKRQEMEMERLSEDLAIINEEMAAANEELTTTNEDISHSNEELQLSEQRFKSLIRQAPFAICVIGAEDLMILDVNDDYLELVGRRRDELENRTIWDAVPEASESYAPVMYEVIRSGIAFVADEHEVMLVRNGIPEMLFIDFVYEPVKDLNGIVTAIMVVGIDVTDKVLARRNIEDIEERIRLAVEAAEMGTFDYNYIEDKILTSDRFNQIFGFDHSVTRDELLSRYHESDRNLSAEGHKIAAKTGKLFYEARLIYPDNSLHWIRVQGNVYFDDQGQRKRILGTVLDITEFKRLQQQKDDFISIASHELKTPITSLKASLQLLDRMKDKGTTPMTTKLIGQATKSMNKISELVEDLLNVSRMNQGQVGLNKKTFRLSEMLDDCCNHVRAGGDHELVFEGDRNLEVFADEQRIDQVVVNFVNNAVKYAPNSRKIYLVVEKLGNAARVSVKDNGPGIPKDKLPHLFDRYFRADVSGFQVSGLGLGLYISADIIERHDGKIGVDSEEGKGSTFWFTLPL
ncbi:PAS domain S-box protein [Pedobacter frigoris]|uniref:PAS domain S-box protein n=1 Tax=Pedobacter frigoris TaxID=2571272 RepID=UPI0029303CC7|nr:PAS domain S-box protein [Pedobacter frigoris]